MVGVVAIVIVIVDTFVAVVVFGHVIVVAVIAVLVVFFYVLIVFTFCTLLAFSLFFCPNFLSTVTLSMIFAGVTPSSCEDNNKVQCPLWAKNGDCVKNSDWMKVNCRKSCKICSKYIACFCGKFHCNSL